MVVRCNLNIFSISCVPQNDPLTSTYADVPHFLFFSQTELFRGLLSAFHIDWIDMDDLCSFREYCRDRARISHTSSSVEEKLTENEIG